jgi:hypothetical protein
MKPQYAQRFAAQNKPDFELFHFHDEEKLSLVLLRGCQTFLLNTFRDIAEHSICQPGRPLPQGLSHPGILFSEGFQSIKSSGFFL